MDKNTPPFDSEEGLSGIFGDDKPVLAMTFDTAIRDEAENFAPKQCYRNGETILAAWYGSKGIRLMRGGVRGNCVFCDCDGYISVPKLKPGNQSFAAAFWLYLEEDSYGTQGINTLFSTKEYANIKSDGCCLMWGNGGLCFRVDIDGVVPSVGENYLEAVFPHGYDGGWLHVIVSVDREQKNIRLFCGFQEIGRVPLSETLEGKIFDGCGEFRIGVEGGKCRADNKSFRLDDFLWFDRALSDADIELLRKYY